MSEMILVVDDNEDTLKIIKKILATESYQVKTAADGQEALKRLKEDDSPALVLLDIMMPKVNGFEVCRTIRSNPRFNHIPILILSATIDSAARQQASALGANDYLLKPIVPSDILRKVKDHLL
ncbi:MAG: response regulator [Candidatus Manganitrophaceae bacterium]|nr:MAG: response regulator [Candidatus Manganitrophaceae bacterium]